MRYLGLVFAIFFTFRAGGALARFEVDFTAKMGGAHGPIMVPKAGTESADKYTIGGLVVEVGALTNIHGNLGLELGYTILFDTINDQVGRQGFTGGFSYSLFGGFENKIPPP